MRTFSDVPEGHCFFLSKEGVHECYFRLRVDTPSSGPSEERVLNAVSFQNARPVHIRAEESVASIVNAGDLLAAVRIMENGRIFRERIESISHASGEFSVSESLGR